MTEKEEVGGGILSGDRDDDDCRNDGKETSQEAAHPGGNADIHESLHDDLSGECSREGAVLACGKQGDGKEGAGSGDSQHRGEKVVGFLDLRDVCASRAVKGRGGEDQDCGIDGQGDRERDVGIDGGEPDGFLFAYLIKGVSSRLHDGGVQVEIVRHHRGAKDADGDEEFSGVGDNGRGRDESFEYRRDVRLREEKFEAEACGDRSNQDNDQCLDVTESPLLEQEEQKNVERGDENAPNQGNVEKEIQRDGGADHLGQITSGNADFGGDPEGDGRFLPVVEPAALCEIEAGDDSQLQRESLEEHRHDAGKQDDREECVIILGASGQICGPVSGIHVAHRHQVTGACKGEQLPPKTAAFRNLQGSVNFGKAGPVWLIHEN